MKLTKGATLGLFTIIITFTAIYLNWSNFLMGHSATFFNFIVSTAFLLLWLIFSFYRGIRRDKTYLKFILLYWGINIISFILIWTVLMTNSNRFFLIPFSIWYGGPLYGFNYLLNSDITRLFLITAPLGLIFCLLGYWIGFIVSKSNKF